MDQIEAVDDDYEYEVEWESEKADRGQGMPHQRSLTIHCIIGRTEKQGQICCKTWFCRGETH